MNDEWVDKLLDALLHRAGLLQSADGENFEFAYRFEEFLAGCHLANRDAWVKTQPSFVTRVRNLLKKQGDYARQVVIWAAGVNAHVQIDRSTVRELVSDLTPRNPVADAASLTNLELAADIARDAGMEHWQDEDVPDTTDTVSRLRARLEEVRDGVGRFEAKVRSRAASAIGRLGDHRPSVQLKNGLPDLADWILIPAGEFPMGCTEAEAKYPDEKPQFPCRLINQPYRISRYPITVEQYQAFVKADGYRDVGSKEDEIKLLRWWTPEGLKWKRARGITGPEDSDPVFQTPNHPRVGVSWFEAVAFCRWLTDELKRKGELKNGEKITLPSEAQWERAARHTDGRTFPWGNEEECQQRCNMGDTGIGHTSAVGLFPSGNAECSAADMAGNVWEWCRTKWMNSYQGYEQKVNDELEGQDSRVLRGGSFGLVRGLLRCARRYYCDPDYRLVCVGFRVVLVAGVSAP
ncbi:MAG: SUMF1/EgtB/PvdO family nonheme iron enzyme [Verrucomicrobia bacterium]|nr:SUMF1/EgtB/PvdO family nonheme iron enzyme [Verrucomicrobiota bacterium]